MVVGVAGEKTRTVTLLAARNRKLGVNLARTRMRPFLQSPSRAGRPVTRPRWLTSTSANWTSSLPFPPTSQAKPSRQVGTEAMPLNLRMTFLPTWSQILKEAKICLIFWKKKPKASLRPNQVTPIVKLDKQSNCNHKSNATSPLFLFPKLGGRGVFLKSKT